MVIPKAWLESFKPTFFCRIISNNGGESMFSKLSEKKFNAPVCLISFFLSTYWSVMTNESLSVGFFCVRATVMTVISYKFEILFPTRLRTWSIVPFDTFGKFDQGHSSTSASFKSVMGTN